MDLDPALDRTQEVYKNLKLAKNQTPRLYLDLDPALELDLMGPHECGHSQELDLEKFSGFFIRSSS